MSLLIDNDMNLPNSCSKCPLKYSSYDMYCCRMIYGDGSIVCVDSYTERRNPACPLVEIPTPHGDLIDRGDVIEEINRIFPCSSDEYEWAYTTVEQADTIIEAEE